MWTLSNCICTETEPAILYRIAPDMALIWICTQCCWFFFCFFDYYHYNLILLFVVVGVYKPSKSSAPNLLFWSTVDRSKSDRQAFIGERGAMYSPNVFTWKKADALQHHTPPNVYEWAAHEYGNNTRR